MASIMAVNQKPSRFWSVLLAALFWLGVWYLCAKLLDIRLEGRGNELLLPYPATVLHSLRSLCVTSGFWLAVGRSLLRILTGLAIGVLAGSVLAVITSVSRWCNCLLPPAIRVIRATPVASFILLILLWTSRDNVPTVISALMVLPVVWENLSQGIRSTDRQLLEMAHAYRFSPLKTVRLIYIPTIRPFFTAAITTSMGLAWKSGAAAEVLCLPKFAIGTQIYNSKIYLEVPDLFAWTLVVVAMSIVLEKTLALLLKPKKGGGCK